jgi:hypothetical protein
MEKHNLNIEDKIINIQDYEVQNDPGNSLNLTDKIVTYYNGTTWRIIPLDIMLMYPVLYDNYKEIDINTGKEIKKDISLVVCPFTLLTVVFEGFVIPSEFVMNGSLLMKDSAGNIMSLLNGEIINKSNCKKGNDCSKVKRNIAEVKTFRNAISEHPDCEFIKINKKNTEMIMGNDYYKNFLQNREIEYDIHPKTLVRIIEYVSSINLSKKYAVVVGYDADKNKVTGYDIVKSKFDRYIDLARDKLEEKNGFIIPCMYYYVNILVPSAKIIYL